MTEHLTLDSLGLDSESHFPAVQKEYATPQVRHHHMTQFYQALQLEIKLQFNN